MDKFSFNNNHIEACNKLIKINKLEFKNEKKEELKIEDVKKVFEQVSKKQYLKVLKFLKKQIDKSNKEQSGGETPQPSQRHAVVKFDELHVNNEINTNNESTESTESTETFFEGNVFQNQVVIPNIVTYGGYTPFQIRTIIILIFCVIYGILEEFNRIRVPHSIDPDLERLRQPASPPPGWRPSGGGRNKKKRQTKKKRATKKNKRKTKSKKKLKR